MPFITVNNATFFYEEFGTGHPLIFLHGLFQLRADTSAELDWLATKYRIIAPDLRGYSQSFPKPRTYPRDFYRRDAEDVKAICEALHIGSPHVLGWSDGGEVTLCLAELMPLRSAAEWGAVGFYGPEMRERIARHLPATWIEEEQKARQGPDWEQMIIDWTNALLEVTATGGDISHADAGKIACPLLIMLGTKDTLNPIPVAQRLIDKVKYGRLEVFEGAGHSLQWDQPEHFRAVLGAFLDDADRKATSTQGV